jgi:hypothetical protein
VDLQKGSSCAKDKVDEQDDFGGRLFHKLGFGTGNEIRPMKTLTEDMQSARRRCDKTIGI